MTTTRPLIPNAPARLPAVGGRLGRAFAVAVAATAATGWQASAAPARAAAGDDPQADYVALFGDEEKRALATPSTKDDAALAVKLLSKAADLKDAPALRRLVLERAADLGAKDPDGLATATDATNLRVAAASADDPDRAAWVARAADLVAQQYKRATTATKRAEAAAPLMAALADQADALAAAAKYADAGRKLREAQTVAQAVRSPRADEFAARVKDVQARQQAAEKYEKLRQRLTATGGTDLLEQVVLGYLLEAGDVATATELAARHPDPAWAAAMAVAARDPADWAEAELPAVADFYRRALDKAAPGGRWAAGVRARDALERYLAAHAAKDAGRLAAQQAFEAVTRALDALPAAAANRSTVVVWNTHHGDQRTVGTAALNLVASAGGRAVWRQDNISIEWAPDRDTFLSVVVYQPFDLLRVELTKTKQLAAGLSEVQVFRNKVNVALGRPVRVSDSIAPQVTGAALTDGITTSAVNLRGYWYLPVGKPGWAEVSVPR
jgi:hypothetical protein